MAACVVPTSVSCVCMHLMHTKAHDKHLFTSMCLSECVEHASMRKVALFTSSVLSDYGWLLVLTNVSCVCIHLMYTKAHDKHLFTSMCLNECIVHVSMRCKVPLIACSVLPTAPTTFLYETHLSSFERRDSITRHTPRPLHCTQRNTTR